MAVKNTVYGGTDWSDGDVLFAADLNDTFDETALYQPKFYSDNTGGAISASTTETDLATLTITAGDLGSTATLDITAGILLKGVNSTITTCTFRLYIDGSIVKTIIVSTESSNVSSEGTAITHLDTSVDTTSNVIVKVTGELSQNNANSGNCFGLTVRGYEKTF